MNIDSTFFGIYLTYTIYHFFVYLGRRNDRSNLAYSLCGLSIIAFHIFSKMYPAADHDMHYAQLTLSSFTFPLTFSFFFSTIFDFKKLFKYIIAGLLIEGIVVVFCVPMYFLSESTIYESIYNTVAFLFTLYYFCITTVYIIKTKQYKQRKHRMVIFAFLPVLIFFLVLSFSSIFGFKVYNIFSYFIFLSMMTMFALAITYQFNSEHKALNTLKENLKKEVEQRTYELAEANIHLKNSEKSKTRYFIEFAHEVKTPMIVIKGYIDKISNTITNNEDVTYLKDGIYSLHRNITNFLDIEKLFNKAPLYIHDRIADISGSLQTIIELFRELASKKNITIKSEIEDNLYTKIHITALERVFYNIIFNAIKYTLENGSISITLRAEGDTIIFAVKDTGIGMNQDVIREINEPYYFLSNKKNVDGLGIGLGLVRGILHEVGATLTIESVLHEGSSFTINFHKEDNVLLCNEADNTLFKTQNYNPIIKEDEISVADYNPSKKTIFLVEDNLETIRYLVTSLNQKFNIYFATDGARALQKIHEIVTPDVIISDIMMVPIDGYQLKKEINTMPKFQSIPFIFLTAKTELDKKVKSLEVGAVDFIAKPFDLDDLVYKINSIIDFSNTRQYMDQDIKKTAELLFDSVKHYINNTSIDINKNFETFRVKYNLKKRHIDIIKLLDDSITYKEIGNRLIKSEKTINNNIQEIYSLLNIRNRENLLRLIREEVYEIKSSYERSCNIEKN